MRRERAVRKIVTVALLSYSIGVQLCLPRDRRYFLLDPPRESLEAVPAWQARSSSRRRIYATLLRKLFGKEGPTIRCLVSPQI